ncbi:hypothetical protein B1992_08190 [Pseudoxanthomonas broegbernensis]|uniref:EF-hand domain-containing protein n=1 Tax=Pseudoxanthomonas broegbernensis TaxID=83619 RepID=A0A7V8K717_9GAMM|nr:hypothetical protein [Pseudoxanthomonas broegbernensis]KAF1686517.1 hypothetical protein B1992_08190 [Pseudoxanthomonas broegbernensis]MBB6064222.1 hypothetical protein [Pseudoxanthomonas broegbernensis]
MDRRFPRLIAGPLLALASTGALAQATSLPLPPPEAPPASAPMQRQSGMVVIPGDHHELTIVRSFEPDSVVGDYRIDFDALDADGDGLIDRREAAANATLEAEFRAVDANADGRLDREELAGWIR